ncbi:hypothetical protein MKZ38_007217 [Zalerion maritima]|uniref:Uncharacterized protein n=1 Tax=Zalerion maritima TaxID=339359 RepID=A0AAD5RI19_9PEZI|nr:hypothetical protein MKZ38_007217 [Zalerion maritima]
MNDRTTSPLKVESMKLLRSGSNCRPPPVPVRIPAFPPTSLPALPFPVRSSKFPITGKSLRALQEPLGKLTNQRRAFLRLLRPRSSVASTSPGLSARASVVGVSRHFADGTFQA